MKKIVFFLSTLFAFNHINAQDFGSFASAVFISQNGVEKGFNITGEGENLIGRPENSFTGDLGSYEQSSAALILNGGEVKTYKNNGANVCSATMYYSIHLIGSTAPFEAYSLPFKAGCVGNVFTDNLGPCNGNDQKWSTEAGNIDLTAFDPGMYAIDVYYEVPGSNTSDVACDETSNIGNEIVMAGTMTFTITNNTLAIKIISFTGKTSANTNMISWIVGDETDVTTYQLEKSTDGTGFRPVSTVKVDPSLKGHYTYMDASIQHVSCLYRLKLTDKNNNAIYSNIIALNDRINTTSVTAIPNPAKDFVIITSSAAEPAAINIFNITGKNFKELNTQSAQTKIDLSGMSNGVYIITYKSAHSSQVIKIIKQ